MCTQCVDESAPTNGESLSHQITEQTGSVAHWKKRPTVNKRNPSQKRGPEILETRHVCTSKGLQVWR